MRPSLRRIQTRIASTTVARRYVTLPAYICAVCVTRHSKMKKHILLPKSSTRQSAYKLTHRLKYPKLIGADVYVARLSNSSRMDFRSSSPAPPPPSISANPRRDPVLTGSLHDELTCNFTVTTPAVVDDDTPTHSAVDSRPCYRCVCYMHSVGIKRVFWTNSEGKWEGAKVRDLVDMLESSGGEGGSGSVAGLGVFVTKHEVLMLRRLLAT